MRNSNELIKKVRQKLGDNRYIYWQKIWYEKIMEIFPDLMNKVPYEVYRKIDKAETKGFKHCELPWNIFLYTFEKVELNDQLKNQIIELINKSKGSLDYDECKDCHWQEQEIHFEYKENEFRVDVLNADIKSEPTAFKVEAHLTPKQVAKNLRTQGFGCRYESWKRLLGYSEEQAYKIKW